MKKITLSLFILLAGISLLHAQTSEQEILDQLANQACSCIKKSDITEFTQEKIQMELSLCFMQELGSLDDAKLKALDADMTDQSSMMKLGQKIGMRMVSICPDVMMKMAQTQTQTQVKSAGQASGTIKGITGNELSYIQLDDGTGDVNSFLWLSKVEGADAFLSNPQGMIGKKVKITFESMEIYSPKTKGYNNKKVITKIEVME